MAISYTLTGDFFEACDCAAICSCWADVEPEMGSCTGLFVWQLDAGTRVTLVPGDLASAVDVGGCKVAAIFMGADCGTADKLLILIDAGSAAAEAALTAAVDVGPWSQVLGRSTAAVTGHASASITVSLPAPGVKGSLSIRPAVAGVPAGSALATASVAVACNFLDKQVQLQSNTSTTLVSKVRGTETKPISVDVATTSPATAGGAPDADGLNILADLVTVAGTPPDHVFDLDLDNVSAVHGRFKYEFA